jgi:hypothetical protein
MELFQRKSFVLIVIGLAFALRVCVSNRPLWYDEALTYWQAVGTAMVPAGKGFSILHVTLIKPMVGWWDEPWMLRLPFTVLGTASIIFFMLATRELMGNTMALIVTMLLAISPFHIYYSTELRMYALALLGSAINFFFFLRALREEGWKNWFGYCVGTLIGLYALWFVCLLLVVQGVYLLFDPVRRRALPKWFMAQLVIATMFLPAIWYVSKLHRPFPSGISWIESRPLIALVGTFYSFVMGVVFVRATWWYGLTFLTVGVIGFLCLKGILTKRSELLLVLGGMVFPLAITLILSTWMHIYDERTTRYLAFSQPFLIQLLVIGWAGVRFPMLKWTLLVVVILIFCTALYPMFFKWDEVGMGNTREAAAKLRRLAGPQDCIAVPKNVGIPIAYYLREQDLLIKQMIFGSFDELPTDPPPAQRLWLVKLYNREMLDYLRDRGGKDTLLEPPVPTGYHQVGKEVVPGRKPIILYLYERSNNQKP